MSIVKTNIARCRDCYRCLRNCPVKAIKIEKSQAYIDEFRCVSCGNCIYECPQKAKTYRKDIDLVTDMLASGEQVAVSVAPSFATVYPKEYWDRIPSVLRSLGFKYVGITSAAAYHTAMLTIKQFKENMETPCISTSCPVVVHYIEKYVPSIAPYLAKVASPMVTHARIIKKLAGENTKIVFIGPCVAKKTEPEIDAVLTFDEFDTILKNKGIDISNFEVSSFDDKNIGYSGFFPLSGGLFRTAKIEFQIETKDVVPISGLRDLWDLSAHLKERSPHIIIEPLFCRQGCVNAPIIRSKDTIIERRRRLIDYCEMPEHVLGENEHSSVKDISCDIAYSDLTSTSDNPVISNFSEEEIEKFYESTGKINEEDRLNCGACGYNSCRDKAIAVLSGMAEKEMCMPYMRRLAEFRSDVIMDTSPNGIVILDEQLNILAMNKTFKTLFLCSDALIDKRISYLIDPAPFESVATGSNKLFDDIIKYNNYGTLCHVLAYSLPEEKKYVGIFVNVTNQEASQEKLEKMKVQTIFKAQNLLEHQINMAQSMAKMLGEYTAKGEELVTNLMDLTDEDKEDKDKK